MQRSDETSVASLWMSIQALSAGMAYLVWRSMRGSPQFIHIADTAVYWYANIAFLFMVSTLNSMAVMPMPFAMFNAAVNTGLYVIAANWITSKLKISRVPAASAMGAAGGFLLVDLLIGMLLTVADLETLAALTSYAIFVAIFASTQVIFQRYKKLPKAIQKPDYKPSNEESFDEGKS